MNKGPGVPRDEHDHIDRSNSFVLAEVSKCFCTQNSFDVSSCRSCSRLRTNGRFYPVCPTSLTLAGEYPDLEHAQAYT